MTGFPVPYISPFAPSPDLPGNGLSPGTTALKCDLRDEPTVQDRLARYGLHTVQYEEGLTVARRIRASRYLGAYCFIEGSM